MKKIISLNKKVTFEDPDMNSNDLQKASETLPTMRRLLRVLVHDHLTPKSPEESDNIEQIRLKLMIDQDFIDLEDNAFAILKNAIYPNTPAWKPWVHQQILKVIREADARKVEIEVKEAKG
jgi:hypothetical protein